MTYNTEKRAEILEFFQSMSGQAFSAEDICSAILTDGHGKSTVYRLISKLVDEGVLRRISDGKTRHVTYQYVHAGTCREHLHLKCKDCGKLIHLDEEVSHSLGISILRSEGFTIDVGALLYGRCKTCEYAKGGAAK